MAQNGMIVKMLNSIVKPIKTWDGVLSNWAKAQLRKVFHLLDSLLLKHVAFVVVEPEYRPKVIIIYYCHANVTFIFLIKFSDDCRTPQGGASCKTCDESTGLLLTNKRSQYLFLVVGKCLTCKKRLYHLDGRCVEAEDCESLGQIPFGKKFSYRACITKMTGECVEPNCRPTIKNCIRSFLNNNKKEICSECKSTRFLVGGMLLVLSFLYTININLRIGKCKFTKACKNGEYADGEECQCEFSDFDDCKICDHFKKRGKPELHRTLSNGVFQTCTQCFKSKFFFNDTCVDTCPEGLTIYFPKPWIKKCVKPYVCEKGTVAFGEDKGQPCVCSEDCIS